MCLQGHRLFHALVAPCLHSYHGFLAWTKSTHVARHPFCFISPLSSALYIQRYTRPLHSRTGHGDFPAALHLPSQGHDREN